MVSREKVAALYMGLSIEENNGLIIVSGSYPVIKPYIDKLKSMQFRYNGEKRVWTRATSPRYSEKSVVKKLFGSEEGQQVLQTETSEKESEEIKKLLEELSKNRFSFFSFRLKNDGLFVAGKTFPLKDAFKDAGARWAPEYKEYFLSFDSKSFLEIKKLVREIEKAENSYQDHKKDISRLIQNWDVAGVDLFIKENSLLIKFNRESQVGGGFRLDSIFDFVRREDSGFSIPLEGVNEKNMDQFKDTLAKARQEFLHRQEEKLRKKEEDTRLGVISVRRSTRPYKVGEVFEMRDGTAWTIIALQKDVWMDEEDAMSFGVMDMDRSGYVHYASARPATEEEMEKAGILSRREERDKGQKVVDTRNKLCALIKKHGVIPPGDGAQGHKLSEPFYTWNTRMKIVGGGFWFVREGNDIWYVQNNGADGDNWAVNNVATGGAGAVGWKASVTSEMEPLIELLSLRKTSE